MYYVVPHLFTSSPHACVGLVSCHNFRPRYVRRLPAVNIVKSTRYIIAVWETEYLLNERFNLFSVSFFLFCSNVRLDCR